jgi:hypothetical protein
MREIIAEIRLMQQALEAKDREILKLQDKVKELEDKLKGVYLSVNDI